MVKNLPAMPRPGFDPWVGKIPWRRAWQPTPVFLPGDSPWTEEPGELLSMGSQRVRYDWATKHDSPGCIPSMLSDPWAALCPRPYHTVRLLSVSNSLPPPHCELLCSLVVVYLCIWLPAQGLTRSEFGIFVTSMGSGARLPVFDSQLGHSLVWRPRASHSHLWVFPHL